MIRSAIILVVICVYPFINYSQCSNRITHTDGVEVIDGVSVSVSSWGLVQDVSIDDACDYTLDYIIGREATSVSGDGSYTFNFSPPVNEITLNFFRLDIYPQDIEEIRLYVNDDHYPILTPGDVVACPGDDNLAVLTNDGNIRANTFTHKGAWEGTIVSGSISSLTVLNDVIIGSPNGVIFSIHFCDVFVGLDEYGLNNSIVTYPNPFIDQLNIRIPKTLLNPMITVYNINGQVVRIIDNIRNGRTTIDRNNLTSGVYFLEVTDNGKRPIYKKILVGN